MLLRTSSASVLWAVLAGIASGASAVALIALIHVALGANGSSGLIIASFAGLCLTLLVSKVVAQRVLIRLSQHAVFGLCMHLSRRIVATPLRRLEELGTPRLLAVLTDDIPVIAHACVGIPVLIANAAIIVCCLVYLGWLSLSVLGMVLIFLSAGILSYQALAIRALRQLKGAREEQDALMKHFRGLTEGVKELQLHRARREAFLIGVLQACAASLRDRNTRGLSMYTAAGTWGQLLYFLCIGWLLFAVPTFQDVAPHVLAGSVLAVLYTVAPLEVVMSWLPALSRASVALDKTEGLGLALHRGETMPGQDGGRAAPAGAPVSWQRLELARVVHSYRSDQDDAGFSLGPLDLTLRPAELTFLVGGNGSGKTTLAKVLTGLYAPEAGEIRIDGRPLDRETAHLYMELFTALFSDSHLFENLLGLDTAQLDSRAQAYLRQLELDHKVRLRGGAFSTTELSRGQRKRLALLTAYLEDRPIYVFDEWAADQDPGFKEVFYTQLLPELKAQGKCVLVITHDERYFPVADRVLRLNRGKLDQGSFAHGSLGHPRPVARVS
jgi:putative ATP-binding cassette transporter